MLAVELSSFQLHYTALDGGRVGRRAQRRRGPPGLVPGSIGMAVRRRQGPDLRAGAARLRLQRRRPGDRAAGARGRGRGGRPRDRLHPRHARASDARRGRRHPGRPGVHRGARAPAPPSCARSADLASPAPHIVENALAAAALARALGVSRAAVRDGLRAFRPDGHRIARSRPSPGRRPGSTTPRPPTRTPPGRRCRPTTRSCGSPAVWPRAPASTTWSGRGAAGCAASCCSAATGDVIAEALARHAPDVPGASEIADDGDASRWSAVVRAGGRPGPTRGHRAARRRAARRWTCSPTTPRAATPSPRPSGRWPQAEPASAAGPDRRHAPDLRGNAGPAGETCRAGSGPADGAVRGSR